MKYDPNRDKSEQRPARHQYGKMIDEFSRKREPIHENNEQDQVIGGPNCI